RKIILLGAALAAPASPAWAGPREETMAGISRCSAVADDRAFLNCVYGAAQPMRAHLGLAPAPQAQQRLVPRAMGGCRPQTPPRPARQRLQRRAMPPSNPQAPPRAARPETAIRERLETFTFDRRGLFVIMLGNGEQWRQDPGDTQRARWVGRASDYVVHVRKD